MAAETRYGLALRLNRCVFQEEGTEKNIVQPREHDDAAEQPKPPTMLLQHILNTMLMRCIARIRIGNRDEVEVQPTN
jgi:hypothetical protein